MRRSLIILPALIPLALLSACSSSDDTASPTTTQPTSTTTAKPTVSSVVVAPENTQTCQEVSAFATAKGETPEVTELDEATAIELRTYLVGLLPQVEAIGDGGPAEIQPWVTTTQSEVERINALDLASDAGRQELGAALVYPSDEVKAANKTFETWAATNCGIDVG